MLGFLAAKQVVEMGRSAFFPDHESDLPLGRSALLSRDDLTPQFGYVGAQYSSTNILLLGINPGNGPRNDFRTPADERMMPELLRFAQNPTELNYVQATRAYMSECRSWPVWQRHCAEVLGSGKLSFEQIGYSNCLPWRTASESSFSENVARKAAEFYVRPLIEELNPCLIVAMGKARVLSILEMTGLSLPKIIVWNRSRAATDSVKRERVNAAKEIFAFAKLGVVGQREAVNAIAADSRRSLTIKREDVVQEMVPISSDVIRLLIRENPKSGKSRLRFDCYRDGMTVADYEKAVLQKLGAAEAKKCKPDLKWDIARHFIRIEHSGRNPSVSR
ncbi:hypothetical protein [uncultured Rhodoblastus sp.]|uniref:hypothetical protein n=1 Tax=uncultured Rhodoblastus sp. TaxID=543037 RepID=UPI0025E85AA9|nr:hypothetical protein [uncultured Rhodoblastus sp.]